MNLAKSGRGRKPEDSITDPRILEETLHQLMESEAEFSIRVEGTSTLPYASFIHALDFDKGMFILKLVRPLPHEMLDGAQFRMLFASGDQRYETLIDFHGREAYLQYRFSLPAELLYADRRSLKRYPFRPRENVYVIASDGGIPGIGVAGPLVNISLGGLAVRVDRMLKLDDGMRIPPTTARFERGMSFPRVRIQDLPRLPLLEVDGRVTHATEHGSEIVLGFAFRELDENQARLLGDCLDFREKILKTTFRADSLETGHEVTAHEAANPGTESAVHPEALSLGKTPDPLLLLKRKTARLCLLAADSELTGRFQEDLWEHGYHRLEVFRDLAKLKNSREQMNSVSQSDLVLVDLALASPGHPEPLAAVRHLEKQTEALAGKTLVILCESVDPVMFLGQSNNTRFLPFGGEDPIAWIETLDNMLGLRTESPFL